MEWNDPNSVLPENNENVIVEITTPLGKNYAYGFYRSKEHLLELADDYGIEPDEALPYWLILHHTLGWVDNTEFIFEVKSWTYE